MTPKKFFEEFFNQFDLKKELLRYVYDGFETYQDYAKYGDAFVQIDRSQQTTYTPAERQLTCGRSLPTSR